MRNRYREMEIRTASPLTLVVRFYDESIRMCRSAVEQQQAGNAVARGEAISRALALVGELRNVLDLEAGGEIASNLDSLYGYVLDCLMESSLQNETRPIEQAEDVLVELRSAWIDIQAQGVSAEASP
jgi:flagellar protein FliS